MEQCTNTVFRQFFCPVIMHTACSQLSSNDSIRYTKIGTESSSVTMGLFCNNG